MALGSSVESAFPVGESTSVTTNVAAASATRSRCAISFPLYKGYVRGGRARLNCPAPTFIATLPLSKALDMSQCGVHHHKLNSYQRDGDESDQVTRVCNDVLEISEKAHRFRRSM